MEPEHHIELNDSAMSILYPPKKIPVDLHEKLRKESKSIEISGLIRKVDEPTEWANAMVVVEKPNGKLRMSGSWGLKQINQKRSKESIISFQRQRKLQVD